MDTVQCEQCGSNIARTTRFCPECGHANPAAGGTSNAPNSTIQMQEQASPGTSPTGGAPTINIGNTAPWAASPPAPQGQPTQYIPTQAGYTQPQYPLNQTQSLGQPAAQPPAQGYPGYSQNPAGYVYQSQVGVAGVPPRDPTIALLLELIGYLGFLGIGHIYAGRIGRGIGLMFGWWVFLGMSFVLTFLIVGICLLVAALAVPVASGLWIKNDVDRDNSMMRQGQGY